MTHSHDSAPNAANAQLLKSIYEKFSAGDVRGILELCSDDVTFQIAGKSPLAGKYTKATVGSQLFEKLMGLSNGTFKLEVHDIMATDIHGLVLTTDSVERGGKRHEYRSVHVWRIQGGKPVAWYEYPRDLYAYDAIWS